MQTMATMEWCEDESWWDKSRGGLWRAGHGGAAVQADVRLTG